MEEFKDRMYVVEQPKHTIVSLVYAKELIDKPLTKEEFNFFTKLADKTDVIYIFPQSPLSKIDCRKFTSLYCGCGYAIINENLLTTFMFVLQYVNRVFEKHMTYLYLRNPHNVPPNPDKFFSNLEQVNMSSIASIICEIVRLGPDELYQLYVRRPEEITRIKIGKFWNKEDVTLYSSSKYNIYTRYSVLGDNIVFRAGHINVLINNYLNDPDFLDYFKTFTDSETVKFFIGSYIKASGTSHLNKSIENFNIGNLNGNIKAEGKKQ